jgi:HSP20 family protein
MKRFYPTTVFDIFFDDFFSVVPKKKSNYTFERKEDGFKFELEIPGFGKDDVKVNIEDNYLKIDCKKENKERNFAYDISHLSEENEIDLSKTVAEIENGILSLDIPIIKNKKKPKQIEVKVK